MRKHIPQTSRFVLALAAIVLSSIATAVAQDEGVGTFNDLVGETIERPPGPRTTPTQPVSAAQGERGFVAGEKAMTAMPPPKEFFTQPTAGAEYDYRFTQQKIGDRFQTDTNEAHTSFSFFWAYSKFLIEYFHVWADASNDAGLEKTTNADGVKTSLATSIYKDVPTKEGEIFTKEVLFTLPFTFKDDRTDSFTATGEVDSETGGYTLTPFFTLSLSRQLDPDRKIKFSLSPGFRVGITDKTFTNVRRADVHGWKGTFTLLPRIDYDLTKEIGVYGSATWGHFTNVHSSDGAAPPDPNSGALATGLSYTPLSLEKHWTFSAAYQYDGFNRDSYQHTVTLNANYSF